MYEDEPFEDEDAFDTFYQDVRATVDAGEPLDDARADRLLYNADAFDADDAYRAVVEGYANADDLDGDDLMRLWQVQVHCRAEGIALDDELERLDERHGVRSVGGAVKRFGQSLTGMLTYRGWTSPHFDISDYALK